MGACLQINGCPPINALIPGFNKAHLHADGNNEFISLNLEQKRFTLASSLEILSLLLA